MTWARTPRSFAELPGRTQAVVAMSFDHRLWGCLGRPTLCLSTLSRPAHERPGAHDPPLIGVRRIQPVRLLGVGQCSLGYLH